MLLAKLRLKIEQTIFIENFFIKAISHLHRNRTKKLKCLNTYGCFHIHTETKTELKLNAEPKTCTNWIFFFGFVGRISANMTGDFN